MFFKNIILGKNWLENIIHELIIEILKQESRHLIKVFHSGL